MPKHRVSLIECVQCSLLFKSSVPTPVDLSRVIPDRGRWYYENLFEHTIFWTCRSFDYFFRLHGWDLAEYSFVCAFAHISAKKRVV
jgi:hypothetical protein